MDKRAHGDRGLLALQVVIGLATLLAAIAVLLAPTTAPNWDAPLSGQPGAFKAGFTLIELSIVLVIIGLIIGGVMVGQELVAAAAVRAQITQIEKYNTAANTFSVKYGYLPGDIPDPYATQFGLPPRGTGRGQGDGNGVLEGAVGGNIQGSGETGVFWVDLSTAGFIDAHLSTAYPTGTGVVATANTTPNIAAYFPTAKIGRGNSVYAYSSGYWNGVTWVTYGVNYFGLSAITLLNVEIYSTPGLTVQEAYNIDKKIDDALPQSGMVTAQFLNQGIYTSSGINWAAGGGVAGASPGGTATGTATTCYDNAGGSGVMKYSTEIGNGANVNCGLSFHMLGAAR